LTQFRALGVGTNGGVPLTPNYLIPKPS